MKFKGILIIYLTLSYSLISCRKEDKETDKSGGYVAAAATILSNPEVVPFLVYGAAAYFSFNTLMCGYTAYQCHTKSKCKFNFSIYGCSTESE